MRGPGLPQLAPGRPHLAPEVDEFDARRVGVRQRRRCEGRVHALDPRERGGDLVDLDTMIAADKDFKNGWGKMYLIR